MESFNIIPFAIDSIGAFLIGGLFGGLLRNLFKLFGFVLGIQIALFAYLDHLNFISINWNDIESKFQIIIDSVIKLQQPNSISQDEFFDTMGIFGGFILGFIIGWKFG